MANTAKHTSNENTISLANRCMIQALPPWEKYKSERASKHRSDRSSKNTKHPSKHMDESDEGRRTNVQKQGAQKRFPTKKGRGFANIHKIQATPWEKYTAGRSSKYLLDRSRKNTKHPSKHKNTGRRTAAQKDREKTVPNQKNRRHQYNHDILIKRRAARQKVGCRRTPNNTHTRHSERKGRKRRHRLRSRKPGDSRAHLTAARPGGAGANISLNFLCRASTIWLANPNVHEFHSCCGFPFKF